jgi:glycosyltransferase involved in cell wall biosynthesis
MSGHVKISIVTPSLNQGQFIEENIQSVLDQGYANFEHIVIDGGSSDGTIDVLKKYPHIKWISEPDRGQADAVNKGFRMARGDVIGWLNADDCYFPGTFTSVVRNLDGSQGKWVIMGDVQITDEAGRVIQAARNRPRKLAQLLKFWHPELGAFHQPGVFFRKEVLDHVGLLDESLYFALDYDLWARVIQKYDFHRVEATFAAYRIHPASKSASGWDAFKPECERVSKRYVKALLPAERMVYLLHYSAYKLRLGRWLPRKLRKMMGLPKAKRQKRSTREPGRVQPFSSQ